MECLFVLPLQEGQQQTNARIELHREPIKPFPPILFEAIHFEKTIPDLAPKYKRPHSRTRVGAFHFFAQGRKMVEYMKSLFATTKLGISGPFSVSVDFLLLLHMAV